MKSKKLRAKVTPVINDEFIFLSWWQQHNVAGEKKSSTQDPLTSFFPGAFISGWSCHGDGLGAVKVRVSELGQTCRRFRPQKTTVFKILCGLLAQFPPPADQCDTTNAQPLHCFTLCSLTLI